jgi:hypothetical protein
VQKDYFTIFQDADFEQGDDGKIKLNVKRINSNDAVSSDLVVLNSLKEYSSLRERIRTKKYSIVLSNSQSVLKTESVNYLITKLIPKTQYVSVNLDFTNDNKVVFFDVTSRQLRLYVYKY